MRQLPAPLPPTTLPTKVPPMRYFTAPSLFLSKFPKLPPKVYPSLLPFLLKKLPKLPSPLPPTEISTSILTAAEQVLNPFFLFLLKNLPTPLRTRILPSHILRATKFQTTPKYIPALLFLLPSEPQSTISTNFLLPTQSIPASFP